MQCERFSFKPYNPFFPVHVQCERFCIILVLVTVLDKASMNTPLGSVYTKRQRQCCDDACDSVLTENNGVAPEWSCNPFSSNSTVFNDNSMTSVIAALTLTLGVNGPLDPPSIKAHSKLRHSIVNQRERIEYSMLHGER